MTESSGRDNRELEVAAANIEAARASLEQVASALKLATVSYEMLLLHLQPPAAPRGLPNRAVVSCARR